MNGQTANCPDRDALFRLLDDADGSDPRIATHVDICARCQQQLDLLTESPLLADYREHSRCHAHVFNYLEPPLREGDLGSLKGLAIESQIGRGGMGVVFRGWDARLERSVAIKLLHRLGGAESSARFQRECRAMASLEHPNVVPVFSSGYSQDGIAFLVMPLIEGRSLKEKIAGQALEQHAAACLIHQVALGLEAAHQANSLHRDVKPENILLDTASGSARLTDFGLVRAIDSATLTQMDLVAGTPPYMSPEQIADPRNRDPRSDVYSLGITLYECLTGTPPFTGATLQVLEQHRDREPIPPSRLNPSLSRDLENICLMAIAKDCSRRYQTAGQFADDLKRFLDGRPVEARETTSLQRTAMWCKRNPLVAFLSTSIVIALATATAVMAISRMQVSDALSSTQSALGVAASQRDVALSAMNDLVYDVHDTLAKREASVEARGEVLLAAMGGLQRIIDSAPEQSDVLCTMADAKDRYAFILTQQVRFEDAIASYREAIAIAESQNSERGDRLSARFYSNLGHCYGRMAKYQEQIEACEESQKIAEELLKTTPNDLELRRLHCLNQKQIGGVLFAQSEFAASINICTDARKTAQALHEEFPDDVRAEQLLVDIETMLGNAFQFTGEYAKAELSYQAAKELLSLQNPQESEDVQLRTRYYNSILELGWMKLIRMKFEDALDTLSVAHHAFEELVEAEPERIGFRLRLASANERLATAYAALGNWDATLQHARQAIEIYTVAVEADKSYEVQLFQVSSSWSQISDVHFRRNDLASALDATREAAASLDRVAERFQMQAAVENLNEVIAIYAGVLGQPTASDPEDVERFKRAYEIFLQLQSGTPVASEFQPQIEVDIASTKSPVLRNILMRLLAADLALHYQQQVVLGAPDHELSEIATQCVAAIQRYAAQPDADATFHFIDHSFTKLHQSPEYRSTFGATNEQ